MKTPLCNTLYEVVTVADENDADYVTRIEDATVDDILQLQRVVEILKSYSGDEYGHNFPTQDSGSWRELYPDHTHEILEWFDNKYAPYSEYGIHTIETIHYYEKPAKTVLFGG